MPKAETQGTQPASVKRGELCLSHRTMALRGYGGAPEAAGRVGSTG